MIGITTLLTLPTGLSNIFLNLGFTKEGEYCCNTDIAHNEELEPCDTALGRATLSKIKLLGSKSNTPVFIEYAYNENRENSTLIEHMYNFFRVIRGLQKQVTGPIIVIMSLPIPHIYDSFCEYERLKIGFRQHANLANIFGHFLGVPVVDLIVQNRKHSEPSDFEWMFPFWSNESIFNPRMQYTPEMYRRLEILYLHILKTSKIWNIATDTVSRKTSEKGEVWNI